VIGEMLSGQEGLGTAILLAARSFRAADLYAGVACWGWSGSSAATRCWRWSGASPAGADVGSSTRSEHSPRRQTFDWTSGLTPF
jgi:hypothetical protein